MTNGVIALALSFTTCGAFAQTGVDLGATVTPEACTTDVGAESTPANDVDLDGVLDDCEWAVANAFRPLRFWAERRDWCAGHNGDSEFIVLDVVARSQSFHWVVDRAFLSAHWLGKTDDSRAVVDPLAELAFPEVPGGHPEVWVAYRKHGSYVSRAECEAGHRGQETCAHNIRSQRLLLERHRNIGSRRFPARNRSVTAHLVRTCVSSEARYAGNERYECFWEPADTFDGWQQQERNFRVTPYERVLRTFGF